MSTTIMPRVVPLFWDKQGTVYEAWYFKKPRADQLDPTIEDPPIEGLEQTGSFVEVRTAPGGELKFPAVDVEVDSETGLVSFSIPNATIAAAGWTEAFWKLIVMVSGEPHVFLKGKVTLGY